MTIRFDAMLDYIDDVPDAGNEFLVRYLRLVAREFCTKVKLWEYRPEAFDLCADMPTYTLFATQGTEIAGTHEVQRNGRPLDKTDSREAATCDLSRTGTPSAWWSPEPDKITLWPTPSHDETETIQVLAWLRPTMKADDIPAWVFESHIDCFRDGLRAKLFRMKDKPWTNPQEAMMAKNDFEREMNSLAVKYRHGSNNSPRRSTAYYM
jgi:hypothetical protein